MVSKWCNICSEIKTASPVLSYCTKCGNDLRDKADVELALGEKEDE